MLVLVAVIGAVAACVPAVPPPFNSSGPIRAAFYYPWFPETWHTDEAHYPSAGEYQSSDPATLRRQITQAQYAGLDAFISSWWGIGTPTDQRLPLLLDAARSQGFRIAPYYEPEGIKDPTVATIKADLAHLKAMADRYGNAWLRVNGKPVIFVYNAERLLVRPQPEVARRSRGLVRQPQGVQRVPVLLGAARQLASVRAHLSHRQSASVLIHHLTGIPAARHGPRLARDPARFAQNVADMKASNAKWAARGQLQRMGRRNCGRAISGLAVLFGVRHIPRSASPAPLDWGTSNDHDEHHETDDDNKHDSSARDHTHDLAHHVATAHHRAAADDDANQGVGFRGREPQLDADAVRDAVPVRPRERTLVRDQLHRDHPPVGAQLHRHGGRLDDGRWQRPQPGLADERAIGVRPGSRGGEVSEGLRRVNELGPCQLSDSGSYKVKHNPWPSFRDERGACNAGNPPMGTPSSGAMHNDVVAGTLPNAGMAVPNICNDAHDCALGTADSWLRTWLPQIMAGPDYTSGRLAIVVTADEDDHSSGNKVLTVVMHNGTSPRVVSSALNHYSLTGFYDDVLRTSRLRARQAHRHSPPPSVWGSAVLRYGSLGRGTRTSAALLAAEVVRLDVVGAAHLVRRRHRHVMTVDRDLGNP